MNENAEFDRVVNDPTRQSRNEHTRQDTEYAKLRETLCRTRRKGFLYDAIRFVTFTIIMFWCCYLFIGAELVGPAFICGTFGACSLSYACFCFGRVRETTK